MAPRTLSVGDTCWRERGGSESILLPSCAQARPSYDISTALSGGPTACESRLDWSSRTRVSVSSWFESTSTLAA